MGIQKCGRPFTNGYLKYAAAPLLMLIFFKKAACPFLMGTSISGRPFSNGNFKKRPPAVLPLAVGNVQGGFTIVNGKFDYMGCLFVSLIWFYFLLVVHLNSSKTMQY
jgi:hypothetical protein